MESWMFISSFEKLRADIIYPHTIVNMVHMPYLGKAERVWESILARQHLLWQRLVLMGIMHNIEYTVYYECDNDGVPFKFPTKNERWKIAKQEDFMKIPGGPIAYWLSADFIKLFEVRGQRVFYIPQDPATALNPSLTIREQMEDTLYFHQHIQGDIALDKIKQELLAYEFEDVDCILKSYPSQLSGGMQQRVICALASVIKPQWIVADEPTKGLDAISRKSVYRFIFIHAGISKK